MKSDKFLKLFEDTDFTPVSYSGRCMYGTQCVSVDLGSSSGYGLVAELMLKAQDLESFDQEDLVEIFRETRQDQMGLGIVVYWPNLYWPEGYKSPAECANCGDMRTDLDEYEFCPDCKEEADSADEPNR